MSWVWPLRTRPGRASAPPTREALEAWFAARPGYRLGAERVSYENPATGVYFSWEWLPAQRGQPPLALELRTGCAEFFLLEAMGEVDALCATFGLEGAGPEGQTLPVAWRAANHLAIEALLRDASLPPAGTLPRAINTAVWQWNRVRAVYGDRLAMVESLPCSVPPVYWLQAPGDRATLLTGALWVDMLPVALPEVDVVLAVDSRTGSTRVIPHVGLAPWLAQTEQRPGDHVFGRGGQVFRSGLAHRIVDDGIVIEKLSEIVRTLGRESSLRPVAADEILDREAARAAGQRSYPPAPPRVASSAPPSLP